MQVVSKLMGTITGMGTASPAVHTWGVIILIAELVLGGDEDISSLIVMVAEYVVFTYASEYFQGDN